MIRPIQVLVIAVAGLFFLWVLRVASKQSRTVAEEMGSSKKRRGRQLGLEFIEPDERAGERVDVDVAVTVGRGGDCDLQVNDTYLSGRHARFANDDGDLTVEDLDSTNGTYVNQQMVHGRLLLEKGDIVQVGGVLFEVVR
ncbi:MAG TPA: FHA domain-containing protein [Acidimicrobiales bacterium]|nr:FHA domain-containing protein [Acidimicrobiales bacterium]